MSVVNSIAKGAKIVAKFAKTHKATICVVTGVTAGGCAIVECGRATYKSTKQIDAINEARERLGQDPLTKKEVVKECVKNYIPTIALTTTSAGLILYGHRCTLKQLSIATAGAKLLETEYNELKESIEDVLGTGGSDENKEIKDKVLNRFAERKHKVYGDSTEPIDYYPAGGVSLDSFSTCARKERFKDNYGGTMWATRGDVRYALEHMKNELLSGYSVSLDDFYRSVDDNAEFPDNARYFEFNESDTAYQYNQEINLMPDSDADGLFWRLTFREEPVYTD